MTFHTPQDWTRPVQTSGENDFANPDSRQQTWMVSFADLMAILLTFMVVAVSTRDIGGAEWQQISSSIQTVFPGDTKARGMRSNDSDRVQRTLSDGYFASVLEDKLSGILDEDFVQGTDKGVEVKADALTEELGRVSDVVAVLNTFDNSLMIGVVSLVPTGAATKIQRRLAWEKGLVKAGRLRSKLMAQGLNREPRITVRISDDATAAGASLLVENNEGPRS